MTVNVYVDSWGEHVLAADIAAIMGRNLRKDGWFDRRKREGRLLHKILTGAKYDADKIRRAFDEHNDQCRA